MSKNAMQRKTDHEYWIIRMCTNMNGDRKWTEGPKDRRTEGPKDADRYDNAALVT